MIKRHCVCHSCGRTTEFGQDELPCKVLRGWLVLSSLKDVEVIDRYGFCSLGCLKKWVDSQAPQVPDIFLKSLEEEGDK